MTDVGKQTRESRPRPRPHPARPRASRAPASTTYPLAVARGARTGFRDRGPGSGTADRVPRDRGPRVACGRRGPARGTRGRRWGVPQCHWLHARVQRASHVRSYVRRSTPRYRSIDKKNQRQPPAAAATHTKQKESSSFPCGSCARICAWSASFFRTIVDLIFVLDDAEPPQSGSAFTGSFEKVASRADEVK